MKNLLRPIRPIWHAGSPDGEIMPPTLQRCDLRGRNLAWTPSRRRANDWIALCGFDEDQHRADEAFTHTIAYTLAGILTTSEILGRSDGIAAVLAAAER